MIAETLYLALLQLTELEKHGEMGGTHERYVPLHPFWRVWDPPSPVLYTISTISRIVQEAVGPGYTADEGG